MTALAMRQTGIKPAAKIVLYWLADHHNGETGQCNPSINRLAKCCEMSRRSVENNLQSLQEAGLIKIINRFREQGGKTSNIYTLCMIESDTQNLRMGCAKSAHGDTQNLRMKNLGTLNLGNEQEGDLKIPSTSKRKKSATSLPKDWVPDRAKVEALMAEHDLTKEDMIYTFEQMKGQSDAKDVRYVNWDAAYANWIRNNIKWGNIGPQAKSRRVGANSRDTAFD